MSILITGVSGQVGGAVARLLRKRAPKTIIHAPSRSEMDLSDPDSIRRYLQQVKPAWIVSSGAYTAVDAAETDRETAFAVNATAPAVLAEEAVRHHAMILHLSTEYVFPGTGERPWTEEDVTGPLNVYGSSKLAGEEALAASGAAYAILRTSWVYSASGKNFVRTMLRLLSTRDTPLRVVADQHGCPTSAEDLAEAMLHILQQKDATDPAFLKERTGIYHCAGRGETTWAGLASAIRASLVKSTGATPPEIIPVPGYEYPTPATRPQNSRLDCRRMEAVFGVALPDWRNSLHAVLERLIATDLPGAGQNHQAAAGTL